MLLQGKVAVVTNVMHFVGKATARALAAEGALVTCHDKAFADLGPREEAADFDGDVKLSLTQSPEALVAEVIQAHGRLDIVVSNDAYPAIRAPVDEAKLEDMRAALEALAVAPFGLAAAVVPQMRKQGGGKIILVTSAAPLRGLPNYAMYVTARAAANGLVMSLAKELGRYSIQVNAVAPNYVESPTYFPPELLANPEALGRMTANIPLGRLGKPEEVAATVAFLASSKADFITGHVLPIAGGWA
jgi:NAD(P)-dependent dehydrogenase (short-subunit alcohol dehydrogenase family)